MIENVEYSWIPGNSVFASSEIVQECADLYSEHYGKWGEHGIRPWQAIKLSADRLYDDWLDNDKSAIYYATIQGRIIGYAIAIIQRWRDDRKSDAMTWVTQLVVHSDYRHKGIAKTILFTIWCFTDNFAWGIVSANPYAIRALEKATRRRVLPKRIKKNIRRLKNIANEYVGFAANKEIVITDDMAKINTKFFVDQSDVRRKVNNVRSEQIPWCLGDIEEGWEWFAFTFQDQDQLELTSEEIESMLNASDSIVKDAYSRMIPDERKQKWMRHASEEIEYLKKFVLFSDVHVAYDLGCGTGRHAIELAKQGVQVTGIDYVKSNIDMAEDKRKHNNLNNVNFIVDDCRLYKNETQADLILCLYDVIGSYANNSDNQKIIKNAFALLKPNGYAVFSVMNYEMTLNLAKHTFSINKNYNEILRLRASNIMETTGNIFDADYYLVDTESHIVYRKEQFFRGKKIPVELVVRDRRFTKAEIVSMCQEAGFSLITAKYVNASDWDHEYDATDKKAKEILVICRKDVR